MFPIVFTLMRHKNYLMFFTSQKIWHLNSVWNFVLSWVDCAKCVFFSHHLYASDPVTMIHAFDMTWPLAQYLFFQKEKLNSVQILFHIHINTKQDEISFNYEKGKFNSKVISHLVVLISKHSHTNEMLCMLCMSYNSKLRIS